MFRRHSAHGPIGLDIGSAGVKLLQFAGSARQPTILAAARYAMPPHLTGAREREDFIRDAVQDALRQHPFHGREVVSALGCSDFQMKSVRLPRMPAEELAAAVQFEAQERFDLGGRAAQLRHLPAGEVRHGNEIKEEVIVFAAPDDVIQARLALLESLKLTPLALDITPCALARGFVRFLRRAEDAQAVNVFVDVGWRATSIVITHGVDVTFVKVVDVGGLHFTEATAKALNLAIPEALDLRTRIILESASRRAGDTGSISDEIATAVSDAVRPLVERLQKDLQLCLRYFAVTFRGQRPESLTFVGGEAGEPALVRILGEATDIPAMIGYPLRGMGNLAALSPREQRGFQPAWSVVCGLALRGTVWVGAAPLSAGVERAAAVA